MKTTGYIALILIVLFQSVGVLPFYQVQQCIVQFKMQSALNNPDTKFREITFSAVDFKKGRINDHEVLIDGRMYDVKSVSITGDKANLLAIEDTDEDNIIEEIKKALNNNCRQDSKLPGQLVKILTLTYLSQLFNYDFCLAEAHENSFPPVLEIFKSHDRKILSPPPEKV